MACAKRSDREEIIAVLEKMSCESRKGAKNPSTDAANTFAPDVSLARNVSVSPIIVLNCLFFMILILYFFSM